MRRVVVLGGLGMFGCAVSEQLSRLGIRCQSASRGNGADLQIDANDKQAICATLRSDDLVIDTAGPFQTRTTALVEAAIDIGFDIVDLNDSVSYAERVLALRPRIAAAVIRVLSGSSTVSAVAAAVVRRSGTANPVRVTAFLAPAAKFTANAGSARSLIESVGRPVRVWRDGRMQTRPGWSEPRPFIFPQPIGPFCGRLFETADAVYLPQIWPSLQEVAMHVDTKTTGLNSILRVAAKAPPIRSLVSRQIKLGAAIAKRYGSSAGGIGYEIEGDQGRITQYAIVASNNAHLIAVAPAVLAAKEIVARSFAHGGLVMPNHHVDPGRLIELLTANGITCTELE